VAALTAADREEHEHPCPGPERLAECTPGVGAGRLVDEAVEACAEDPRVRGEHVEEANREGRADDRARNRVTGVLRFLTERCSGLEADEGEDREDHATEDAVPAADRMVRVERLQVEVACIRDQHPHGKCTEDRNLEGAEDDPGRRRDPDVAIGEQEDDHGHQERPDDPLAGPVPAGLARHHFAHRPAELEVEKRCNERLEEDEEPCDVEARPRAERAGRICVQAAC